jgi:hypothetical protein
MQISEATLKKRDRDAFDGGFDAALEPMSLEEEQSVHHMRGDDGVNAVRHFLTYRRNSSRHAAAAEKVARVREMK